MLTIALVICLFNAPASAMDAPKAAILEAARNGMLEQVEELIKIDKQCVNATDKHGNTALIFAANKGHLECAQALIAAGAQVDLANEHGVTALEMAADMDHPEIIKLLLANKAAAAHVLKFAIKNNRTKVIKNLLDNGADVNMPINWKNETALYRAAHKGKTNIVFVLLFKKANPNQPRPDGITPLMIAAQKGHIDIVDMLIKFLDIHAVDINAKAAGYHNVSALYLAAQNGKTDVAALLLRNGADLNIAADKGVTPLMVAAAKGHEKIVRLLLHYGADHTLQTKAGCTAHDSAMKNNHTDICKLIEARNNQ